MNDTLTPLLNREFQLPADGRFQFTPLGEFPIVDPITKQRVIQVVDADAVRLMNADIQARKGSANWPGLLIDREHFSFDPEKESRAAGWANDAEARADGLWGPIRFSNSGKADVEGGEFRFLSPVFDRASAVPLGGNRFRVTRLLGLALTNTPNIRAIAPLTNREDSTGREANQPTHAMKDRLILLLGLAATVTDDELVTRVQALRNRASEMDTLQTKHTALETEHTALKNRHTTLLNTSVERVLDENKDVITAESKDAWKNRLNQDFDGTLALLNGVKRQGTKAPVHADGKARAAAAGGSGKTDEGPFLNRVRELRAADSKLSESDAIVRAAYEKPDLYEQYRESLTPPAAA